jgi:YidC/Oxa1 family membrane protein insertase
VDQRRWLLFIAVTSVIYVAFYITFLLPLQKREQEKLRQRQQKALAEKLAHPQPTTGTLALPPPEERVTSRTTVGRERPTTPTAESKASEIVVRTQLYRVVLTSSGGRPTSWEYFDRIPGRPEPEVIEMVPQHPATPDRELPLEVLFKEFNSAEYPEFNFGIYQHEVKVLDDGTTEVTFTSPEVKNLQVIKRYRFRPDDYVTHLQVVLRNTSPKAVVKIDDDGRGMGVSWGPGVRQFPPNDRTNVNFVNAVYATPKRVIYGAPGKPEDERTYRGDVLWAGATDKFFLAAVIPDGFKASAVNCVQRQKNLLSKEQSERSQGYRWPTFTNILYGSQFEVPAQHEVTFNYDLFIGPKRPDLLREIGKETGTDLNGILFYFSTFRWMRALKLGLMHSLAFLHSKLHNYGVAIFLLTILIRLLTHPLAHKGMKMQAKTMAEMKKIKPLLDEVNRKHKGDPAKKNQEMMRLYKEHHISPFAPLRGCLPMLVQIPIFFALYSLLNESIDLRGASFLWISDLAGPDKLVDLARHGWAFAIPIVNWPVNSINLLPILMGASQFLMSKLTPTPTADSAQQKQQKQMMLIFSIMFPVMLYNLPSGLFIYWLINNVWQSVHQLIANRIIARPPEGQPAAA